FDSAPVSGTFIYTPAAGTVLNVGNAQALHVDFTPTDTVNLAAAAKDVTINVLPAAPTVMGLMPSSGPVRAFVTVSGANFELEHTQVAFNGTPAVVISETTTTLTTTVPDGATTGPLTVATTKGTASRLFTVTPVGSFLLAASPPLARVIAGDQASVSLLVEGTGNFGSLVALSMSEAPAGITTSLSPALLVPNASGFLSLDVASSVAPGTYAFTISGQALVDGQTTTRTAGFMLQVLAPTTSAVTGRVLTAEAVPQPIPGATVTLGSAFTLTDAAGNFVLLAPPTGDSMLLVDGRTASTPVVQYPAVEVNIDVASSGPTRIPFIIYLPRLDTAHPVTLPLGSGGSTTQAVQVTTPLIPGLAVTIPAGTTITGPDGNPVSQITITPVPIDRSPMPFPPGVTAPMLFTIQPGGADPSQSLPITFPNVPQAPPGSSAQLYFFDLVTGSWAVWGTGTLSDDGTVIVSDPAFGLPRFAWHYAYSLASLLD